MCGIFLIYNRKGLLKDSVNTYIKNAKLLEHRGDKDTYRIINNKLLLYHNRIYINETDPNNVIQPIIRNNIMTIVDGKIYNYKELYNEIKKELPTYNFRSKSNSEILIPLYLLHGSGFISKIRGMFSFILYDATKNILIIVRDHIGITSLYYTIEKNEENGEINTLMISSEMKALTNLSKNINIFGSGKVYINGTFFTHYSPRWTELDYIPNTELNYNEIKQKLIDSVLKYTLSDQPIGILLLGGLDSSLIASIMVYLQKNKLINNSIKTYMIELENTSNVVENEQISEFLNLEHTTYNYTIEDVIDLLEDVIYHLESYDITTIRKSIPLYLLSMQIKEDTDTKILFTGEVSDEIFNNNLNKKEVLIKLENKVNILHKSVMSNTLELTVPFADRDIIDYIMNIDLKLFIENDIEQFILRKVFDNNEFLPHDILWNYNKTNENISDEILISLLKNHSENTVSDEEFNNKELLFPINTPLTKEAFLYRKIFEKFYPHECCI